ncbi:LAMI_0G14444g1_1 [Lachancea mirantina]|uniref:LAMI_0G14444g1_1 n=1 Tax=Lachancea mirantina TaxID=1230905 RepID=A0A1G4KC24_9SACH|nr:LAMI_0G14444g1_1 [Lachancea mirantina]
MPSKNSINRPHHTTTVNHKIRSLAKKRDARERAGLLQPARSDARSKSGEIRSIPIDLYKGEHGSHGPITTKTLSKKRAKKIERNLKYAEQRKLLVDVQKKAEDSMEIDRVKSVEKRAGETTALSRVKAAIFQVLDDSTNTGLVLENGNGTTLGGPFFP